MNRRWVVVVELVALVCVAAATVDARLAGGVLFVCLVVACVYALFAAPALGRPPRSQEHADLDAIAGQHWHEPPGVNNLPNGS